MNNRLTLAANRKRLKTRHIFLIAATAVLLIGDIIWLSIAGGKYNIPVVLDENVDVASLEVRIEPEGVVRYAGTHTGTEFFHYLFVELEQVGGGEADVIISYINNIYDEKTGETERYQEKNTYHLKILPFGLIYDTTFDNINGLWMQILFLIAFLIVWIITLTLAFLERRKNGEFSYAMVTLGGVIIFLIGTVIYYAYYTFFMNIDFFSLMSVRNIAEDIYDSAKGFVTLTIIPLALFNIALSVSNIRLVQNEGFRIQNLLGVLLGFATLSGIVILYFSNRLFNTESVTQHFFYTLVVTELSYLYCYFECMLISTVFCAVAAAKYKVKEPIDYIVILGCAIRGDGSPTPLLRGRIERALAYDREQAERFGHRAKFVPSGGQGSDEVISEAESMKRWLMEQGVEEDRILKEDKSVNTYENMAFSKKVIEDDAKDLSKVNIAFSTTNYHVFRGYTLARQLGMKVRGLSAKTKLYFFPNAFLREFVGLLWNQKLCHLLFFIISTLVLALAYMVVYI